MKYLIPALILSFSATTYALGPEAKKTGKVAVLVNLGSLDPPGVPELSSSFKNVGLGANLLRQERQSRALYESLGYEVIVLSVNLDQDKTQIAPTGENLRQVLENLAGIRDLKIDLLGHAQLVPTEAIPTEMRERYPGVRYPDVMLDGTNGPALPRDQPLSFVALHSQLSSASPSLPAVILKDSIGVGDFRSTIEKIRGKNPNLAVSIHAQTCYSGALGIGMAGMPDVRVFSSSEPTKIAHQLPAEPQPQNPSQVANRVHYYGLSRKEVGQMDPQIRAAQTPAQLDYRSHWESIDQFRKHLRDSPGLDFPQYVYNLPGEPRGHDIMAWCLEKKPNDLGHHFQTNGMPAECLKDPALDFSKLEAGAAEAFRRHKAEIVDLVMKHPAQHLSWARLAYEGKQCSLILNNGALMESSDRIQKRKDDLRQRFFRDVLIQLQKKSHFATMSEKIGIKKRKIKNTTEQIRFLIAMEGEPRMLEALKRQLILEKFETPDQAAGEIERSAAELRARCATVTMQCETDPSILTHLVNLSRVVENFNENEAEGVFQRCQIESQGRLSTREGTRFPMNRETTVLYSTYYGDCLEQEAKQRPLAAMLSINLLAERDKKLCEDFAKQIQLYEFEIGCGRSFIRSASEDEFVRILNRKDSEV